MNQPRNPSHTPDPDFVLGYITRVLGLELSDWQQEILLSVIAGYGYAAAEAAIQVEAEAAEPQPRAWVEGTDRPRDNADAGRDESMTFYQQAKRDEGQRLAQREPDPTGGPIKQAASNLAEMARSLVHPEQPQRAPEVTKGYNTQPAPQHARRASETPIADGLGASDPRNS